MVTAATLNTTLSIVDAAASILTNDKTTKIINRTAGAAGRVAMTGNAITAWTSQTTILSRMFVAESLLGEPILPHLTKSIHEWYAAQIIAGLQLTQMVDGMRTVQDIMGVVQTGHNQREKGIIGNIAARRFGQENFLNAYRGEPVSDYDFGLEAYQYGPDIPNDSNAYKRMREQEREAAQTEKDQQEAQRKFLTRDTAVRAVKTSENRIGPMGELFEVKLSNPNGMGVPVTVPVFIQMQPSIVPEDIAPRFIDLNVPASTWQRWTMRQAGELTFWKDFVFHRDHFRRQKALLKDPTAAAALSDFMRTIAKKDKYALDDATDAASARQSSNLANSVMILSEDAVTQATRDSGIDLHNPRDRQRYFKNTYTMILVIVDPLHQRVTIYFNGLDGDINCSYSDFRPKDSHFDPKEFMSALQAFSTNNISRMR